MADISSKKMRQKEQWEQRVYLETVSKTMNGTAPSLLHSQLWWATAAPPSNHNVLTIPLSRLRAERTMPSPRSHRSPSSAFSQPSLATHILLIVSLLSFHLLFSYIFLISLYFAIFHLCCSASHSPHLSFQYHTPSLSQHCILFISFFSGEYGLLSSNDSPQSIINIDGGGWRASHFWEITRTHSARVMIASGGSSAVWLVLRVVFTPVCVFDTPSAIFHGRASPVFPSITKLWFAPSIFAMKGHVWSSEKETHIVWK